jgi:hypothetical protein
VTEAPGTGRVVGCDGPGGGPSGLVQVNDNLVIALDGADGRALLDAVHALWREAGLDVVARYLDSEAPALFVRQDGYTVSFEVPLRKGEAHLRGSTPCLAPE